MIFCFPEPLKPDPTHPLGDPANWLRDGERIDDYELDYYRCGNPYPVFKAKPERANLIAALKLLPEYQRYVLIARYVLLYSTSQIAITMHCPPELVATIESQALANAKAHITRIISQLSTKEN